MDHNVGRILAELEEDGLADDTIVFFYSDHGAGLPRHKRVLHDSGMHVPAAHPLPGEVPAPRPRRTRRDGGPPRQLRRLRPDRAEPGRARHPRTTCRAPPFLGPAGRASRASTSTAPATGSTRPTTSPAPSATSEYLYIRTYMPHLSYNQPSAYSDTADIRREIERLAGRGRLMGAQLDYAGPVPAPRGALRGAGGPQQIENLVYSDAHQDALSRMRHELTVGFAAPTTWGSCPRRRSGLASATAPPGIWPRTRTPIPRRESPVPRPSSGVRTRSRSRPSSWATLTRRCATGRRSGSAHRPARPRSRGRGFARRSPILRRSSGSPPLAPWPATPGDDAGEQPGEASASTRRAADLDAAYKTLRKELRGDDLDAALLACRAIELLGGGPPAAAMAAAAVRARREAAAPPAFRGTSRAIRRCSSASRPRGS